MNTKKTNSDPYREANLESAIDQAARASFRQDFSQFGGPYSDWDAAPEHVRAGHRRDARPPVTIALNTFWGAGANPK